LTGALRGWFAKSHFRCEEAITKAGLSRPNAGVLITAVDDLKHTIGLYWPTVISSVGGKRMRFLVKVSFPVEAGNAAVKKNGLKVIQKIQTTKA
jgi:hypothetical protein